MLMYTIYHMNGPLQNTISQMTSYFIYIDCTFYMKEIFFHLRNNDDLCSYTLGDNYKQS